MSPKLIILIPFIILGIFYYVFNKIKTQLLINKKNKASSLIKDSYEIKKIQLSKFKIFQKNFEFDLDDGYSSGNFGNLSSVFVEKSGETNRHVTLSSYLTFTSEVKGTIITLKSEDILISKDKLFTYFVIHKSTNLYYREDLSDFYIDLSFLPSHNLQYESSLLPLKVS